MASPQGDTWNFVHANTTVHTIDIAGLVGDMRHLYMLTWHVEGNSPCEQVDLLKELDS